MKHFKFVFPILIFCLTVFYVKGNPNPPSGKTRYTGACIAFYNLENLFDTIDDPKINDEEFLPGSAKEWGTKRYEHKLHNMASVIVTIGSEINPDGPAILGVSEIENKGVMEDLANTPPMKSHNYKIIHYDSPDRRGIDVGLFYQPKYFTPTSTKSYRLHVKDHPNFRTRDQLLVNGTFLGEPIHIIVVHWPSRYGGEKRSMPFRAAAADLSHHIVDSLLTADPNAKVIFMGDLNDDPNDKSVTDHMKAVSDPSKIKDHEIYDPMADLFKKGVGSLAYHDSWDLFDQMMLTKAWITDTTGFHFYGAKVDNNPKLLQVDGPFKGYPYRTWVGDQFMGGYSDHLPVYSIILKKLNN